MALTTATEHVVVRHAQVFDDDLAVAGTTVHRLDLANPVPARRRDVDDECRVGRLRQIGVVLGARQEDGETRPPSIGDEPLVTIDDPLVAVAHRCGTNQRRIASGNFGLRHGEAAHLDAVAQRPQVRLLLLRRRPVEQRVHVALVGRLTVQHERPVRRLGGLRLDHRQLDVTEAHATPLRRHLRQPQPGILGCLTHAEQQCEVLLAIHALGVTDLRLAWSHDLVDECPDTEPDVFQFGREREVDGHAGHRRTPARCAKSRATKSGTKPLSPDRRWVYRVGS